MDWKEVEYINIVSSLKDAGTSNLIYVYKTLSCEYQMVQMVVGCHSHALPFHTRENK